MLEPHRSSNKSNNSNQAYDLLMKTVMIGHEKVGKSALAAKYCDNKLVEKYVPTIGIDFTKVTIKTESGKIVRGQIWDTAGQERFRNLIDAYLQGAIGIYLCFDLTNYATFQVIKDWMNKNYMNHSGSYSRIWLLIGTKYDLFNDRKVKYEEAKKFADKYHMDSYLETSIYCDDNNDGSEVILLNENDRLKYELIVYGYFHKERKLLPRQTMYNFPGLVIKCCLKYYSVNKCVSAKCVIETMAEILVKKVSNR